MNTNLVATLTLVLATNWTGYVIIGKEAGCVVTNHIALVSYEGTTNSLLLKQTPSSVFVWRDPPYYSDWPPIKTNVVWTNVTLNYYTSP